MRRVCLRCGLLFDSTNIESPCRVCGWKIVRTSVGKNWFKTDGGKQL